MHLTNNVYPLPYIPIHVTTFLCGIDHVYIQEATLWETIVHETRKVSVG